MHAVWTLCRAQSPRADLLDEINVGKDGAAGVLMWIQDAKPLPEFVANDLDGPKQVGISGNHYRNVKAIQVCIV